MASYKEDRYGVVQKDIPRILESMLGLLVTLEAFMWAEGRTVTYEGSSYPPPVNARKLVITQSRSLCKGKGSPRRHSHLPSSYMFHRMLTVERLTSFCCFASPQDIYLPNRDYLSGPAFRPDACYSTCRSSEALRRVPRLVYTTVVFERRVFFWPAVQI